MSMTDVTNLLSLIEGGDPSAAEQLLPLVYEELRKLAAAKLAQEKPGQTLQATALVHEAYLRLVGTDPARQTNTVDTVGHRRFELIESPGEQPLAQSARSRKPSRSNSPQRRTNATSQRAVMGRSLCRGL